MLIQLALVLFMIPGVALFYSGMNRWSIKSCSSLILIGVGFQSRIDDTRDFLLKAEADVTRFNRRIKRWQL